MLREVSTVKLSSDNGARTASLFTTVLMVSGAAVANGLAGDRGGRLGGLVFASGALGTWKLLADALRRRDRGRSPNADNEGEGAWSLLISRLDKPVLTE